MNTVFEYEIKLGKSSRLYVTLWAILSITWKSF